MAKDVARIEGDDDLNPRPLKRVKLTPPPSSPLSSCPPSQPSPSQQLPISAATLSCTLPSGTSSQREFAPLSPSQLLLSIPRIIRHPPSHPLHVRSLQLSLVAFRRVLSLPVLNPEEETRAWTGLAEVGLRVVGGGFCDGNSNDNEWAKGVEVEVEKAIGKGLVISRNHPSLRPYKHHLTILSAQLSIWQHSFKYAKSLLRRLVESFLPSDPKSTIYGAWLELISTLATSHAAPTNSAPGNDDTPTKLRPSADTRKQDIYAAFSALTSLHALARGNGHEDICLLADVIRLRIIFERDSDQGCEAGDEESELGRALLVCENGLELHFLVEPTAPSASTSANPTPAEPSTPLLTSLRLQTLTLGVLHYTHKGRASAAAARLSKLHALCDAGALDPILPSSTCEYPSDPRDGEGRVEVILDGKDGSAEKMWVSVPHPRCMLLLSYLATSKRDAVGRKPKRKMYASEGINVSLKEAESETLVPTWSSLADLSLVSATTARIHADLLSELVGISILRSDFPTALSTLADLTAHLRTHRLWDTYAPLVTLHHAHVAHALGKTQRAEQCYRVAAHLVQEDKARVDAVAGAYVRVAARVGEAALRIGVASQSVDSTPRNSSGTEDLTLATRTGEETVVSEHPQVDVKAEAADMMPVVLDAETKRLAVAVVKDCYGMGGALEAISKVIESCLSEEILKSKESLRDALTLASSAQDNYLRAVILALVAAHYLHTAGTHAQDLLGTCEQLVAGLGAAGNSKRKVGDPDRDKAQMEQKVETDSVGNGPLRLWIGERFLEMYKRAGKDKKALRQAAANKHLKQAVDKLSSF
ncbi:hypothetical protein HWV62_23865 [Athelia sp. TMB]|nr:hypothetical protein HWV62_23865 [Athelia sp. TMB]